MKTISLDDFIRTGEGANGSSYSCISDPLTMVKLYNTTYPLDTVFTELEVARKVYDLGIPSPTPGEIVTDGTRTGIMFQNIVNKRSYSRILADEPERTEEITREFAQYCRNLHKVECPEGLFPDAKQQFLQLLEAEQCFNDKEKTVIADFINSVPDATTALHGDMHMGNIISTLPKGAKMSDPHEVFFIDLGYFSRGYPLFDLGMTKNICISADEDFRVENFHITGKQTEEVWKWFVDEYFEGKKSLQEANELVDPFMAVKMLLVSFNIGSMPPHYESLVRKIFNLPK